MNDVIILARDHERLLAAARQVVGAWRAHQTMAEERWEDESGKRIVTQPVRWAALAELAHYVEMFTCREEYAPKRVEVEEVRG